MNTDTPRTDGILMTCEIGDFINPAKDKWALISDHARQLERELNAFHTKLTSVMPDDYKDWHQNSKLEWPEVAAITIKSLRESNGQANQEFLEQARLLGMSMEREAGLRTTVETMERRIKRLEEAGEQLWKKAHAVSCEDVYQEANEDEIPVTDLPPDTIVYDTDFGDGVSAGDLVALNKAMDDWKSAKNSP